MSQAENAPKNDREHEHEHEHEKVVPEGAPQSGESLVPAFERSFRSWRFGGSSARPPPLRRRASLWERAAYRWVAASALMGALFILYTNHPYYRNGQFQPFRIFYTGAFVAWLSFGLVYVCMTLRRFSAMRYMMRDSALHLLLLLRALSRGTFWRRVRSPRVRTTVLGICVKAFFTPLMVGFLTGHVRGVARAWFTHKHVQPLDFTVTNDAWSHQAAEWWSQLSARLPAVIPNGGDFASLLTPSTWSRADVSWGLGLAYDIVFMIDCGWALMGYASESRWLGNKTRSVEPSALGWMACLACYPPFNNVLGTYLPLDGKGTFITNEMVLLTMRAASVLLFAVYASATVSFGFKFSNLTNRGIVTRGPYRVVRHPAYLCKCSAWWLEHLPTMTVSKALFLTLLCGVYIVRAWTEERHLGRDPEYRAYKRRVRWMILPGIC